MKNLAIFILATTTLVSGYFFVTSKARLSLAGLMGKTESIHRGDLTLPINATGEVRPSRRVEIKSEASGEVIEITKQAGDRVKAGELLIRLQRDDEERIVNRAKFDMVIAAAKLEEAKLILKQTQTVDLAQAKSKAKQLQEQVKLSEFRLDKLVSLPEHQRNDEELLQRETTYHGQLAQLEVAEADIEKMKIAIPRAQQRVKQAQATYETMKNNVADAEKRLSKTLIVAPIDGIVANVLTQTGEVIQGGKTTLTGGTVLVVLLDLEQLIVRAEVDESDIGRVLKISPPWAVPGHDDSTRMPKDILSASKDMEHLPVISVESFREEKFSGVIERIFPEPTTLQGVVTYLVDVVITSDNRSKLLPGMRADVQFTSEHVEDVVLCPNEAIREGTGGHLGVYVPDPDSIEGERATKFIPCKFGLDNGTYSEVREGLSEDMIVYTKLPRSTSRNKEKKSRRN